MAALRCSFCSCSFCNRTVGDVERIISRPNPASPVHICNDCVEVCVGILRDGTGQDDAPQRFKLRRPISESLPFTIAVLMVVGAVFCVPAYVTGGIAHLEQTAVAWVTISAVAVLLGRWLRRFGQVKK